MLKFSLRLLFSALPLSTAQAMAQNGGVLERIATTKTVRVCIWPDYFGISYRDPKTRQWNDIDQPGVVVAVANGSLHEPVMKAHLKAATLMVLDTPNAREREVESGRADVFMTDFPFSLRMQRTTDWARLVKPDSSYYMTPYACMRPGDDHWHARIEDFLARTKRSGELMSFAERHGLLPIAVLD